MLGHPWAVGCQGGARIQCDHGAPASLRTLPGDKSSWGISRCWDMPRLALGILCWCGGWGRHALMWAARLHLWWMRGGLHLSPVSIPWSVSRVPAWGQARVGCFQEVDQNGAVGSPLSVAPPGRGEGLPCVFHRRVAEMGLLREVFAICVWLSFGGEMGTMAHFRVCWVHGGGGGE
jgi:hypothetical protein